MRIPSTTARVATLCLSLLCVDDLRAADLRQSVAENGSRPPACLVDFIETELADKGVPGVTLAAFDAQQLQFAAGFGAYGDEPSTVAGVATRYLLPAVGGWLIERAAGDATRDAGDWLRTDQAFPDDLPSAMIWSDDGSVFVAAEFRGVDSPERVFSARLPELLPALRQALGELLPMESTPLLRRVGTVAGFSDALIIDAQHGLGVVAATAVHGSGGFLARLGRLSLDVLADGDCAALRGQRSSPVPRDRARTFAGRYHDGNQTLRVWESEGRLWLRGDDRTRELRSRGGSLVFDDRFGTASIIRIDAERLLIDGRSYARVADPLPPAAPPAVTGLLGDYGGDRAPVLVYERGGSLWLRADWLWHYRLVNIADDRFRLEGEGALAGQTATFERLPAEGVTGLRLAGRRLAKEDAQSQYATFTIDPLHPADALRRRAREGAPPPQPSGLRTPALVDLERVIPGIALDIRYASTNNFMQMTFYESARAFLQQPAAQALSRVAHRLQEQGLGLQVYDAYRPWFVTSMFWDATPDDLRHFVANPANGSRHNRGCAVDLTLVDLATGTPVPMGAGYDEFSRRAYADYPGGTSRQRWYRRTLRTAMEAEGFEIYGFEWWHFDYRDWQQYPIMNAPFTALP